MCVEGEKGRMSNRQESFPGESEMFAVTVNSVLRLKKNFFKDLCEPQRGCAAFKFFVFYFSFLYETAINFCRSNRIWKLKCDSAVYSKIPFFIVSISLIEIGLYYLANDELKRILLYDPKNNKEIWRFLTYMLIHKDEIHLSLNLIIQGFVGFLIEFEQGHIRTAVVYFGGGLAGSLGTFLFSSKLMAGASGGIYSLLTSHVPNVLLNYETINYLGYRLFAVVFLILSDAVHVSYHILFRGNVSPIIGWEAHISGALGGLVLGFLIFEGTLKKRRKVQEFYNSILQCVFR